MNKRKFKKFIKTSNRKYIPEDGVTEWYCEIGDLYIRYNGYDCVANFRNNHDGDDDDDKIIMSIYGIYNNKFCNIELDMEHTSFNKSKKFFYRNILDISNIIL